jgi:hypothetical protein
MDRRAFLAVGGFGWFPWHHPYETVSVVKFRVLRYRHSKHRYLLIHGNESTAREVLTTHMYTHPGIGFIVTNTTRNVDINGGKLDPNRMFSRVGATANLKRLNPSWTDDQIRTAADELDRHREKLLQLLLPPPGGMIVALHNNAEGYNVNEELADSDLTSIKQPERPHEFFLCTDPGDYGKLAKSPFNVVLQNKKPTGDDGSLSRLSAARGIRYVNLEVTLGALEAQLERLRWLEDNLT